MINSDSRIHELWKKHFPQLIKLEDTAIRRIIEKSKHIKIPTEIQVSAPGVGCNDYVLVVSGSIRVQLVTEKGREVVLYHVRSGEGCILTTSCLLSGETFPAEGYTEERTEVLTLSASEFDRVISASSNFRRFVFKNFSHRLANVISRIEQLCSPSIDRCLATILLNLSRDNFTLATVTHQELANELGTAREVVSRHLKRFEVEGWVELGRGTIKVNSPDALILLASK